jgi:hypothetical protein
MVLRLTIDIDSTFLVHAPMPQAIRVSRIRVGRPLPPSHSLLNCPTSPQHTRAYETELETPTVLSIDPDLHLHGLCRVPPAVCPTAANQACSGTIRTPRGRRFRIEPLSKCLCPCTANTPRAVLLSKRGAHSVLQTLLPPNPSFQGTVEKLRFSSPSALRASAAPELER